MGKAELLTELNYIQHHILYGGNDPEDYGDVKEAVTKLIEVVKELAIHSSMIPIELKPSN